MIYETLLAIWLLSGIYIQYAAIAAALTFSGIMLSNPSLLPITFRDIAMIFTALALIFLTADLADSKKED